MYPADGNLLNGVSVFVVILIVICLRKYWDLDRMVRIYVWISTQLGHFESPEF